MSQQLYVYGASGHGKVVIEIIEALGKEVVSVFDDNKSIKQLLDYPVVSLKTNTTTKNIPIVFAIGDNNTRKALVESNESPVSKPLIHPSAIVSPRAVLKNGTVVMPGAIINSHAEVGHHCIINSGAVVEHDCLLDDYVHISPNAALAGDVKVGEGTQIGIGAQVIQGITIGKWCTIGAGAVIIRDVPDGGTVVGNPGKEI
jgi:sugar O-acyltransferase (sialic acid O-acetyltransferase NeuD family)